MHLALATALLAALAGQVRSTGGLPEATPSPAAEAQAIGDEEPPVVSGSEAVTDPPVPGNASLPPGPVGLSDVMGRSEEAENEDLRRSRIPFLPSAAAPVRNRTGTHLAVGAMGQLRTRNISADTGFRQWDTDLEVIPGISLFAFGHKAQLTLAYVPRFYFPAVYRGAGMSILNRARIRLDWSPSKAWSIAVWGSGIYGDYSQLVPSSTPGGPGPTPPTLDPIRTFSTFPYLAIDVNGSVAATLGRRTRLRVSAGWFDVGGVGTAGQEAQPRTWGPRASAALDVFVGTRTTLSTTFAASNNQLVGGAAIRIAAAAESWTQRWSAALESSISLGVAVVNNPPLADVTVGNVLPAAGLKLTWAEPSHDLFRLVAELGLGPYVDTYLQAAYQRITGRIGAEWFLGKDWKLELSLASALVPFTIRAPESYAVMGASAVWSPARWATLLAGGYAQTQLLGGTGERFVQITGYVSASFQSPDFP